MTRPTAFWDDLELVVRTRVETALSRRNARREALIAYLRDVERLARAESDRRQTIQIIASGRSLLGDRIVLERRITAPPASWGMP